MVQAILNKLIKNIFKDEDEKKKKELRKVQRITVGGQYSNGWAGHDVAVFWSRPFSNQQSIFPVLRLFLEKCPKEILDTNMKNKSSCMLYKFQNSLLKYFVLSCKNWPWIELHNSSLHRA